MVPESGPSGGGTSVLVSMAGSANGSFLQDDVLACVFDMGVGAAISDVAIDVAAKWVDARTVRCTVPPMNSDANATTVHVSVTANGGTVTSAPASYAYFEEPNVKLVSPSSGSVVGGTLVAIRGTGFFDSPASACRFGNSRVGDIIVTPHEVIDSTHMACRAPSHAVGKVVVEVTMNGDSYTNSGATFEYHPTVTLTSVSPHMGPVSGNTVVEVYGSGFVDSPLLACRFGKLALVPAVFDTSSHVTCVTPAMAAGIQGVEVTTNGVDLSANSLQFFVEAPPQVCRDTRNVHSG